MNIVMELEIWILVLKRNLNPWVGGSVRQCVSHAASRVMR